MKKRTVGILRGILFSAILLSGCDGKNAAETVNEEIWIDESEESEAVSENLSEDDNDGDGSENQEEIIEVPREKVAIFLRDRSPAGEYLTAAFDEVGYEAVVQYAQKDAEAQIEQIRGELNETYVAFVIDPVDSYGFMDVMPEIQQTGVPVINYNDLMMDTDEVDYYITFGGREIGQMIGAEIVERADLKKARDDQQPKNIEFFMGSTDDTEALFVYNGIMGVLQEYFDDGTLVCRSGRTSFNDSGVLRWNEESVEKDFTDILSEFYQDIQTPDIICTGFDGAAIAVSEILEENGMTSDSENWPVITGIGCEAEAVKNIVEGKLSFSIFADPRVTAHNCAELVQLLVDQKELDELDYEQYDNGTKIVGTYLCESELIDEDNYEILIDNGYYTAEQVEPEATPTPMPEPTEMPAETDNYDITEVEESEEIEEEAESIEVKEV